jgi:NADPH:quinone reductase-like Zn-dependent oxidoreductase
MKAAQIDNYGEVSAIEVRETEKPTAKDDQVVIEVGASSLNPFDLAVLAGHAHAMAPLTFPATLGLDVEGTVVEVGASVSGFGVGERVYGTANAMFGASGAFAEYAVASAGSVAQAPESLTDGEAASLPTAGISGLQGIETLNVQEGQKVFVHGGAGGAGSVAIQVAKARGAYVTATASTDNVEFLKSLGADEVIDYKKQDYKEFVNDYDAVFNTVRSDELDSLLEVLKKGGAAVSLTGPFDEDKAKELGVTTSAQMTQVTTASLTKLKELVESGDVKPTIDRSFAIDDIKEAYGALANESIKGKVVITLR